MTGYFFFMTNKCFKKKVIAVKSNLLPVQEQFLVNILKVIFKLSNQSRHCSLELEAFYSGSWHANHSNEVGGT